MAEPNEVSQDITRPAAEEGQQSPKPIEDNTGKGSLPGSVGDDNSPNHDNPDNETRPSTTLEVDMDGVATMSDPSTSAASKLPPLKGSSQDGDGLEGYRQNLNEFQGSPGSEVNSILQK